MNISKEGFAKFSSITNLLEYRTLMCLLGNTDEYGVCSSSQADIAKQLSIHRQAVNRSIRNLCNENIISIEKVGVNRIYHFNPDYCLTNREYKELYKKFNKFKIKNMEVTENE